MTHWQGSPSAIHPRQSGQFTQDTYFVQNQRLSASHLGPYTVDSLGYLYPLVEGLFACSFTCFGHVMFSCSNLLPVVLFIIIRVRQMVFNCWPLATPSNHNEARIFEAIHLCFLLLRSA